MDKEDRRLLLGAGLVLLLIVAVASSVGLAVRLFMAISGIGD